MIFCNYVNTPFLICFFLYLVICKNSVSCFICSVTSIYIVLYLNAAEIILHLASRNSCKCDSVLLDVTSSFFEHFFSFWHRKVFQVHGVVCLPFLQGLLVSFGGEEKVWTLSVHFFQ